MKKKETNEKKCSFLQRMIRYSSQHIAGCKRNLQCAQIDEIVMCDLLRAS